MIPPIVDVLFDRQAEQHPHDIAVSDGDGELSYRELGERADAVARLLRGVGVCRETYVSVLAEPSVELLVAILGVMKAGGAYLLLDPDNPVQRSALLLRDSGARIVLAQRRFADLLPVPAVVIEDAQRGASQPSARPPAVPGDPACLIYTSGSTGRPKGVVLTHHGLANLAFAAAARLRLGSGDRFLQLAAVSFSAFLEEVFPALLCGATVVMAGYHRALPSTDAFLDLLEREAISSFEITTARWHELVDDMCHRGLRFPQSVRIVLMGGEVALPERVAAWARFRIPLVHVYGPTETTATATYYDLPVAVADTWTSRRLPIGGPIPNTRVCVLDERMDPVPAGLPGELHIGGVSLARGYLGQPARTAESFVPSPFGPPGERLYRTGDLVRQHEDGELEFLGRRDDQIKLHGHRIEPGEIEAALNAHPSISQSVVVLRVNERGDRRLVAFLVASSGRRPTARDLRDHLAQSLPSALIPSTFAELQMLPVTPHGKIDRAALAAIDPRGLDPGRLSAAPATQTQRALATIWADVLGLDRVGPDDNFLELGGHSLLMARMLARVSQTMGVNLLLNQVFEAPTVAALAAVIDRSRGGADSASDAEAGSMGSPTTATGGTGGC